MGAFRATKSPSRTDVFSAEATRALLDGLARAGVGRLLVVGLATSLETEPRRRIMDAPAFPLEHRPFSLGHAVSLRLLRASSSPVDWLMLTPPMTFSADAPRTGLYRAGDDRVLGETLAYADLAVALIDEIETPTRHRTRVAVADRARAVSAGAPREGWARLASPGALNRPTRAPAGARAPGSRVDGVPCLARGSRERDFGAARTVSAGATQAPRSIRGRLRGRAGLCVRPFGVLAGR